MVKKEIEEEKPNYLLMIGVAIYTIASINFGMAMSYPFNIIILILVALSLIYLWNI